MLAPCHWLQMFVVTVWGVGNEKSTIIIYRESFVIFILSQYVIFLYRIDGDSFGRFSSFSLSHHQNRILCNRYDEAEKKHLEKNCFKFTFRGFFLPFSWFHLNFWGLLVRHVAGFISICYAVKCVYEKDFEMKCVYVYKKKSFRIFYSFLAVIIIFWNKKLPRTYFEAQCNSSVLIHSNQIYAYYHVYHYSTFITRSIILLITLLPAKGDLRNGYKVNYWVTLTYFFVPSSKGICNF